MRRPELALIHGWGVGSFVWEPLLPMLANSFDVRPVALPGYGTPPGSPSFHAVAEALADSLAPGSHVCGWSLGALLALQAAMHAPHKIERLILVGATPCFAQRPGWAHAQPSELLDSFCDAVAGDTKATLRRFIALFNQGDARARTIGRALVQRTLTEPCPDTATLLTGLGWLREVDLRAQLAIVKTSTLLIHGENDPLMPCAAARWLQAELPHAQLELFAGAAHAPFINDPERFARLIVDFSHAPARH